MKRLLYSKALKQHSSLPYGVNSKAAPSIKVYGEFPVKLSKSNKSVFVNTLYCVRSLLTTILPVFGAPKSPTPPKTQPSFTIFKDSQELLRLISYRLDNCFILKRNTLDTISCMSFNNIT